MRNPRRASTHAPTRRYGTPLRYPGGKGRLAPFFWELYEANNLTGAPYAEPYAGGAGIAIELLNSGNASHIYLNDCSRQVYSFWKAVKFEPERLCRRVRSAKLTVEEWKRHREVVRNPEHREFFDVGFSTFYLNRCNRSGVLNGGLIGGLEQSGDWAMDARFPRAELIARIERIAERADKMTVTRLDAMKFVSPGARWPLPRETVMYFDPPYYERADSLYYNHYKPEDHAKIAKAIQLLSSKRWIVSYDAHQKVMDLYRERSMFTYGLHYSAAKSYEGQEVFIFSDALNIPRSSKIKWIDVALKRFAA
jgi:DNA adenine methylase